MYAFCFHTIPELEKQGRANHGHAQFLQRGRALALWRRIVRGSKRIADKNTREETVRFAREEFVRNKDLRDIVCSSGTWKKSLNGNWKGDLANWK
jgi:hypothetical protein